MKIRELLKTLSFIAGAAIVPQVLRSANLETSKSIGAHILKPLIIDNPVTVITIGMENRGNILGDYRLHFPDQMGIVGVAEPIKKRNDSMQRSILFLRIIDLLSGNTFLNALNLPMP